MKKACKSDLQAFLTVIAIYYKLYLFVCDAWLKISEIFILTILSNKKEYLMHICLTGISTNI